MKAFKDSAEEIDGSKFTSRKNCELCGKHLKHYQSNYDRPYKFVFINITQKPAEHYFCSKKCKNEWIFNPNNHQIADLKTPSL
ncbi:MAG: hypothetical protein KGD70_12615 [Candidatus Lokiarchaeota archaeon]|jgi:endogenous inhibitor of DNA gyrase (YacG/DUF329 family)|nr:hypothetical protein [Candidatus Lokiarchaeota archaeon]